MALAGVLYTELIPILNKTALRAEMERGIVGPSRGAGTAAGKEIQRGMRPGLSAVEQDAMMTGRRSGSNLGNEFTRGADGRLRNARGQFARSGNEIGTALSGGVGTGARRGASAVEESGGRIRKDISRTSRGVGTLETTTRGSMAKVGDAFGLPLAGMSKMKLGVAGVAVAVVGAGVATVKVAGDFQESTTQLVTGAGESEKALGMVRNGLLNMAGQVGVSAADLSKGLYLIESAGFHGAAGLNILKVAAEGAKVGNADMETVANSVTSALKAYHKPASDAASVTNTLIATVAHGKTHMQDLASSLGNVLPISAALHVPLSEVGGAMATMTAQGTNAAKAATALRFLMMNLVNPTHKAASAMQDVGLTSKQVADTLSHKGINAALTLMTDAVAKKFPRGSAAYVQAMAQMVGGTRGMTAALELSGAHAPEFIKNSKAIGKSAGDNSGKVHGWALVQKDFNQRFAEAKDAVGALAIRIGTALLPAFTGMVDWIKRGTTWLTQHLTPALKKVGDIISPIAKAISGGLSGGGKQKPSPIAPGTNTAGGQMNAATRSANIAAPPMPKKGPINAFVADIVSVWKTLVRATREIWTTVWRVIVTAVGIIKAIWTKYGKQIFTVVKTHFIDILNYIRAVMRIIGGFVNLFMGVITGHWGRAWKGIKQIASGVWLAIRSVVREALNYIWAAIRVVIAAVVFVWRVGWRAVAALFRVVWKGIKALAGVLFRNVVVPIRDGLTAFGNFWRRVWNTVASFFGRVWRTLVGVASRVWGAISGAFRSGLNAFVGFWRRIWNTVSGFFSRVWRGISGFARRIWNDVYAFYSRAFSTYIGFWRRVWNAVSGFFSRVWRAISGFARRIWNDIYAFYARAFQGWINIWKRVWNTVSGFFSRIWRAISNFARKIWHDIAAFFSGVLRAFIDFWKRQWNSIKDKFVGIWHDIWNAGKSAWHNITSFFSGALKGFIGFWKTQWTNVKNGFVNIWKDIGKAVASAWGWVERAVATAVNKIIDLINDFTGFINKIPFLPDIPKIGHVHWGGAANGGVVRGSGGGGGIRQAANGTVLPGYSPGVDSIPFMLSPGEGVLVPEAVRALGPSWVLETNRKFAGGRQNPAPSHGRHYAAAGHSPGLINRAREAHGQKPLSVDAERAQFTNAMKRPNVKAGSLIDLFLKPAMAVANAAVGPALDLMPGGSKKIIAKTIKGFVDHTIKALFHVGEDGIHNAVDPVGNAMRGDVIAFAKKFIGTPYVWGGSEPGGFDCSGLVEFVLNHFKIHPPRTAHEQQKWAPHESKKAALPADLAFWGNPAHHVAFWLGNNKILQAPHTGANVEISSVNQGSDFAGFGSVPGLGGATSSVPGVAQWRSTILNVLRMLHQPASLLRDVEILIKGESNGVANAGNLGDRNARAGNPSMGLAQVIGPTFRAYAGRFAHTPPMSHGVSLDPTANVYAGLNYGIHNYGSIANIPGIRSVNRGGPYLPYDAGGSLHPGLSLVYNGTGRNETVLPPAESAALRAIAEHRSGDGGGQFTGKLYLDSGQLLGVVDGRIEKQSAMHDRQLRNGRIVPPR